MVGTPSAPARWATLVSTLTTASRVLQSPAVGIGKITEFRRLDVG